MMHTKAAQLTYRLERLEFRNGAELGFRRARMRYHVDNRSILIDQVDSSPQEIDRALAEIADDSGMLPEIKTIFYEMVLTGNQPIKMFYHPLEKGAGVRLERRPRGLTALIFSQEDGREMFSKEWTLRDVTAGKIDSDFNVWQFHGWRHEG
jgi:hypothetical protein